MFLPFSGRKGPARCVLRLPVATLPRSCGTILRVCVCSFLRSQRAGEMCFAAAGGSFVPLSRDFGFLFLLSPPLRAGVVFVAVVGSPARLCLFALRFLDGGQAGYGAVPPFFLLPCLAVLKFFYRTFTSLYARKFFFITFYSTFFDIFNVNVNMNKQNKTNFHIKM